MMRLSRRDFLVAAVAAAASTAGIRAQTVVPSLKDVCRGVFLIGTAFDFRTPTEFTPAEINFIKAQFNAITPENSMKPGPVHPQEQTWNWTPPDTLVQFGQENDIKVFGHTLVWHSQTNPRFYEGATRDELLTHGWGPDYCAGSNVVDVYVRYLRRKLGPSVIETVRGFGYRVVIPVATYFTWASIGATPGM